MMLRQTPKFALLAALTATAAVASIAIVHAQAGKKAPAASAPASTAPGAVHLVTAVGSFKILGVADNPATGTVDMNFTGTVLVSGPDRQAVVTPGPGVRLELNRPEHAKRVYFGKGHIRIAGTFHDIQFFGRDLNCTWAGSGVARIYGEFDKNLNTGEYWWDGDTEKNQWGTGGMLVINPKPDQQQNIMPKVKVSGKSG